MQRAATRSPAPLTRPRYSVPRPVARRARPAAAPDRPGRNCPRRMPGEWPWAGSSLRGRQRHRHSACAPPPGLPVVDPWQRRATGAAGSVVGELVAVDDVPVPLYDGCATGRAVRRATLRIVHVAGVDEPQAVGECDPTGPA